MYLSGAELFDAIIRVLVSRNYYYCSPVHKVLDLSTALLHVGDLKCSTLGVVFFKKNFTVSGKKYLLTDLVGRHEHCCPRYILKFDNFVTQPSVERTPPSLPSCALWIRTVFFTNTRKHPEQNIFLLNILNSVGFWWKEITSRHGWRCYSVMVWKRISPANGNTSKTTESVLLSFTFCNLRALM